MEEHESVCSRGGGAEAVLNLQPNSSISIAYHSLFGSHEDLLLLEIDNKLLQHILDSRVIIRGESNEEAVLCTPSTTYALKFVGNSNSIYLIPPSDPSKSIVERENESVVASVIKLAPGNMELVEVAPRLDKLKSLLTENPYSPNDDDDVDDEEYLEELGIKGKFGLYRWEDLVARIQASDAELRDGLRGLSAVEINGYWRIVDEKYMGIILSMLLHNSVLQGWSFDGLIENEVLGVMESDGFLRKIVLHCLEMYGSKVDDVSHLWSLDEKRVCVHFARSVLSGGKRKMESFMAEWMRKIPSGMSASFEMLEGEVLVEMLGVETWVRAFSASSLPFMPAERFAVLFRERQKWEWKDLQPYIRDLRVPGLSSEALLLKYTRRTQPTPDAEPIFCAR